MVNEISVLHDRAGRPFAGRALSASAKRGLRRVLPLPLRRRVALWLGRTSLPARGWWSQELLRDWAAQQPSAYHRFLWEHHLAYAETYEVGLRFGAQHVPPSRLLLFEGMLRVLAEQGVAARDVDSVLEVGCSLGYLLRHLELNHFGRAQTLDGVDIDAYAIEVGQRQLEQERSRVRLLRGDSRELPQLLGDRTYDVTLCAGVLMYLAPADATAVVAEILGRTRQLAVFAGLAHPARDNCELGDSERRTRDDSFIHNIDAMVRHAGGRVIERLWEGPRLLDGHTLYFVYATPGAPASR